MIGLQRIGLLSYHQKILKRGRRAMKQASNAISNLENCEGVREAISELKQERDKMERALKKMISMYVVDDYIYGEDRLNEINKRFERMMREA